ncbi:MAG: S-methyl-5-thioribose-1-phosphate isomerase [Firmicutes bacterium]|nr:S-methyl-5-thioribose-1-phosphate isomerase [Bacillota bacterium]
MKHIEWKDHKLYILDQRKLPNETVIAENETVEDVCEMIRTLAVRGAPAIGIAAAYGIVIAAEAYKAEDGDFQAYMQQNHDTLAGTRPTAVNLFWALNEMKKVWETASVEEAPALLLEKVRDIEADDIRRCMALSEHGAVLIPEHGRILTHCNAGALATGGYGTALGIVRKGFEQGKVDMVYADETRPLLQGARLTAYELQEEGIPVTLITDNMAAHMMKQGKINMVITGADRIAANGDAANKIGTYGVAVLAKHHNIPFYITAPLSTFDLTISSGSDIIIEERDGDEVRQFQGNYSAPKDVPVENPAFDVTPHELITALITEKGVITGDFEAGIRAQFEED